MLVPAPAPIKGVKKRPYQTLCDVRANSKSVNVAGVFWPSSKDKLMLKTKSTLLAAIFAFSTAIPAIAQDVTGATVLATVNGEDITMGHLIATRLALPEQYQALPDDVLFEGILEQLIQQTVLSQAIGELSHRAEIQLENERRTFIAGEVIDDVMTKAVTEEALQSAYDAAYSDTAPEPEYNASHILVETKEEAESLIVMLTGGADFAELAREHSTGPSGVNGGELGWFGPGMMVKPFEDAVMLLEAGQISPPVQTQFGWHVLILNETREKGVPSLAEVRDDLIAKIEDDAVEAAVSVLLEAAEITRADLEGIDTATLRMDELID